MEYEFNIGDEVEIIADKDGYCPYSWTTVGSIGVIVEPVWEDDPRIAVAWSHFGNPSCRDPSGTVYSVDAEYLKLLKPMPEADKKYAKIIRKIKSMEHKRLSQGHKVYGTQI